MTTLEAAGMPMVRQRAGARLRPEPTGRDVVRKAWPSAARREAERSGHLHGRSKAGAPWSHGLVAYGLDRFHKAHLRTPTLVELRAGVDDLPSYATIRRLYGNAGNMLRFHGYRVRSPGGQPGRSWVPKRDSRGRFLTA